MSTDSNQETAVSLPPQPAPVAASPPVPPAAAGRPPVQWSLTIALFAGIATALAVAFALR